MTKKFKIQYNNTLGLKIPNHLSLNPNHWELHNNTQEHAQILL
jgi:hypothetical protein